MKLKVNLWELFLLFLALLNIGTFYKIVTEIFEELFGEIITALLFVGGLAYCKIKIYKKNKKFHIDDVKDFLWEKEVIVNVNDLQKYKKEYINSFPIITDITDNTKLKNDINTYGGAYDI